MVAKLFVEEWRSKKDNKLARSVTVSSAVQRRLAIVNIGHIKCAVYAAMAHHLSLTTSTNRNFAVIF